MSPRIRLLSLEGEGARRAGEGEVWKNGCVTTHRSPLIRPSATFSPAGEKGRNALAPSPLTEFRHLEYRPEFLAEGSANSH